MGINLEDNLVFIDEFPGENLIKERYDSLISKTKFLRNLCRSMFLPSILSGTDSNATNLIGHKDAVYSGADSNPRKWVKVIVKLVPATLKSLCCTIKFNSFDDATSFYLSDFISDDGLSIKYDEFSSAFLDPITEPLLALIMP